ncbi:MAG: hypothetical protein LQ342_004037 [Letrouitia transgressa]|nr:MAG: hypothetical protein LQ342_004037 [Letrouitia transgressa]
MLMHHFYFKQKKPYTAITVQIDRLTSSSYETDDITGIVDLVEVIRLQTEGPTEAARAIRKKLKYGNTHKQLRALTILDGLIENAGARFQRTFADEPLLERLRVSATDSIIDQEVRKKCATLFKHWATSYKNTPGMEGIAALYKQLPQRKKPPRQESSKVLKESEPDPGEDPFGHSVSVSGGGGPVRNLRSPTSPSSSSNSTPTLSAFPSTSTTHPSKSKSGKKSKSKPFNLDKEKPQMLQTIASSSIASTNLMNSLRLINRESKRVSEDQGTVDRFDTCKLLRRQVLRYIQHVESEQWLGSLIQANESLVEALMAFEVLDKDLEDDSDSDSDVNEWDSDEDSSRQPKPPERKNVQQAFAGLSFERPSTKQTPPVLLNGKTRAESDDEEEDGLSGSEQEGADDPFADINAVHTPKEERPGMTW